MPDEYWYQYPAVQSASSLVTNDELRAELIARKDAHFSIVRELTNRAEAAEKRLAEVEAARDEEAKCVEYAEADLLKVCTHRDRLVSALRRQVENIEHWLETGEPATPEESQSIYEQLKAALSGSSDPRKDVARRCVEIAQFHPNSVIGKLISEKIASEFSLDTKEGTDAGE